MSATQRIALKNGTQVLSDAVEVAVKGANIVAVRPATGEIINIIFENFCPGTGPAVAEAIVDLTFDPEIKKITREMVEKIRDAV